MRMGSILSKAQMTEEDIKLRQHYFNMRTYQKKERPDQSE